MAVLLPCTLLVNALSASVSPLIWTYSILLPSCALGLAARFWPVFQQNLREKQRLHEQEHDTTFRADGESSSDQQSRQQRSEWQRRYEERMWQQSHGATAKSTELYDRLGVSKSASLDEISRAFRAKALQWHPVRNPAELACGDGRLSQFFCFHC